ncbi:MAG TPA: hypothetical protein VLC09_06380 [Polyangiaceae bacterium]|nr:hypothetical protein [Polyangiaceae bacterium]
MKRTPLARKRELAPTGRPTRRASRKAIAAPTRTAESGLKRKTQLAATEGPKRKTKFAKGAGPKRKTQLAATEGPKRKTEFAKGTGPKRKTPLAATEGPKRKTQLTKAASPKRSGETRSAQPRQPKAEKRIERKASRTRAPERSAAFLSYLRTLPCDVEHCVAPAEAHHWGRHGVGSKCSDWEAIPLCHDHHVEGWHRHGTLPGRSREEWLNRWRERSAAHREVFEATR